MKKINQFYLLLIAFIISIPVNAQKIELENSLLWKIEHSELEEPSYILGTLHIMCEDDFNISEKIVKAVSSTDQLVLEVNISDPSEIAMVQKFSISNKKLSEQLSEDQLKKLTAFLKEKMNMSLSQVDNLTLQTIYSLSILQTLTCENKKYYEFELADLAKKFKKPIKALESAQEQINYLDKAYTNEFIFEQLALFDQYKASFNTAIKFYKDENIDATISHLMNDQYTNDNLNYWLLSYRNKNWAAKIPDMLKKQSSVFAVGAAHLAGENGIIYSLRKKGYKITPVF